jgi:putative ABC transport system permease protein
VDWRNFQPNFFVVFPLGVLEEAPQFHVLVTRAESAEAAAALQRHLVTSFPNISCLDLSLILNTVDSILDTVSFAIRFMALFCIGTGFIVLTGAVVSGRYQRMKESVLLRTLGASRGQIRRILFIEYVLLGLFASVTGLLLALPAGWAVSYFLFDSVLVVSLTVFAVVAATVLSVVVLVVIIGMTNSRGILAHPPLEVLRAED